MFSKSSKFKAKTVVYKYIINPTKRPLIMANKPADSIFSKRAIFKPKIVNYKNRINIEEHLEGEELSAVKKAGVERPPGAARYGVHRSRVNPQVLGQVARILRASCRVGKFVRKNCRIIPFDVN